MELLRIYLETKETQIINQYNKLIEEERNKNKLFEKVEEILEDAKEKLTKLYMTQFTEEEIENFKAGNVIKKDLPLTRCGEIMVNTNLIINRNFENGNIEKLKEEKHSALKKLYKLFEIVEANLDITNTKEEIEEVLIRYEILDKKTKKLNLKEEN